MLAVLTATSFQVSQAPAVGAFDEHVTQWNIYGTCVAPGECGSYEAVDTLAQLVAISSPKPVVITLNELCAEDVRPGRVTPHDRLSFLLIQHGYTPNFIATSTGTNCGSGGAYRSFGNGIYQVGAVSTFPSINYQPSQDSPSRNRTLTCYNATIFAHFLRGCVTHLDPPDGIAATQSNQIANMLNATMSGQRTVLGGDLNIDPAPGWGAWRATSSLKTWSATSRLHRLDYLLGSTTGHSASYHLSRYCNAAESDHCAISGYHIG